MIFGMIKLVRCYDVKINMEKTKVMRISRLTYLLIFFLRGVESLTS